MTRASFKSRGPMVAALAVGIAAALPVAAAAQVSDAGWAWTAYLQQSFPKQTNTNQQIEQINQYFGADFDTWDDVANLNLGIKVFKQVAPNWQLGLEWDYSRGGIDGEATVETEAGPASLAFEQKYSIYTDILALAHFFPCRDCQRFVPFVLGGVGVAYEKDKTTLSLRNEYIDEWVEVDNDGWFPVYTVGLGINAYLSQARDWYLEFGGAYVWSRLKHDVPAEGTEGLLPLVAPTGVVTADTDSSGPNWWIGIGKRF